MAPKRNQPESSSSRGPIRGYEDVQFGPGDHRKRFVTALKRTLSLGEAEEEEKKKKRKRSKGHRRPLNPKRCYFVNSFTILGGFSSLFLPLYELMIL
ncbi:unnamed protein product [Cuscuta epithymum]|uniref:Uncharacterized protein n=1 Tax=Cuscuta epithymum TaxID=186058 RepID=A0AAV0DLN3_9ASTE|nr:unnamed protein product [Cuscuta epithymum]CAH9143806.1 unnamed protein product [Cuscuta epithymum]